MSSARTALYRLYSLFVTVRFGGGVAFFDFSNNRMKATRNAKEYLYCRTACTAPSFSDGKKKVVVLLVDKATRKDGCCWVRCTGVHEATFRIDNKQSFLFWTSWLGLGVAPAYKALSTGAPTVTYMYRSNGECYSSGSFAGNFAGYDHGDLVAVRLDLDANTVAFLKNGAAVAPPKPIATAEAYHFAFEAGSKGEAVTIVENME